MVAAADAKMFCHERASRLAAHRLLSARHKRRGRRAGEDHDRHLRVRRARRREALMRRSPDRTDSGDAVESTAAHEAARATRHGRRGARDKQQKLCAQVYCANASFQWAAAVGGRDRVNSRCLQKQASTRLNTRRLACILGI